MVFSQTAVLKWKLKGPSLISTAFLTWQIVPKIRSTRKSGGEGRPNMAPSRYARCPENRDWPNWLFLMQHHGLPTRLLDWTESILIAAYFAVCEYPDEAAALWALAPGALNDLQVEKRALMSAGNPETKALFDAPFDRTAEESDKIVAVMANQIDPRMMVQLSGFTIHGSRNPLDSLPKSDQFLVEYEIPATAKEKIKNQLGMVGIMEANLFPDLDHLASDLASRKYDLK